MKVIPNLNPVPTVEQLAEDLRARCVPGDKNKPETPVEECVPCGQVDAVIFLGDIEAPKIEQIENAPPRVVLKIVDQGREARAMAYLKAADENPEAAAWKRAHPGECGYCRPDITPFLTRHVEILRHAEEQNRPIEAFFPSSRAGINANQPEHVLRWNVVTLESGIWGLFYV